MNVKQWLSKGYRVSRVIRMLEEEKENSFYRATNITAPIDSEKVKNSAGNNVEQKNVEYTEYSILLDKKIRQLKQVQCEIEDVISKIEDADMYEILHRRYILFERFADIAEEIHLSESQTFRIHKRALEKIEEILNMQ